MNEDLIAPCGMNCALCSGYLALKNTVKDRGIAIPYCTGCRARDKQCAFLKKRCDRLLHKQVNFCYECPEFPCAHLVHLDKRYRTLFRMSMIANLQAIRDHGMTQFLQDEAKKWQCPDCGESISCHNGLCFSCGLDKLKARKQKYRWEDE